MKHVLTLLLLGAGLTAQAQILGKSIPEYTTTRGTIFHKGDTIRLALGTDIGGRFKYVAVPPNFLLNARPLPFDATYANQRLVIKDIRVLMPINRGTSRTVAIVPTDAFNGHVDMDAAEEAGEIVTAHNRPTRSALQAPGMSVADELLKLKKLQEAGVITQQEFEAQKAKLLK